MHISLDSCLTYLPAGRRAENDGVNLLKAETGELLYACIMIVNLSSSTESPQTSRILLLNLACHYILLRQHPLFCPEADKELTEMFLHFINQSSLINIFRIEEPESAEKWYSSVHKCPCCIKSNYFQIII